jgi:trk system potassium uptake protein TrkH
MRFSDRSAALVVAALVLLTAAGALVLRTPAASRPGTMNFDRAVFAAFNAATLTGFQLPINPDELKPLGQFTIALLMAAGTLAALVVGGWALVRLLSLPYSDQQIVQSSVMVYLAVVLVGATVLMPHGVEVGAATFQAASAFGNCGLTLGRLPGVLDWRTHVVLLPLALIGGLGIPVLIDLGLSLTQLRRPLPHTIAALTTTAGVYLLGLGLILLLEWLGDSSMRAATIRGSAEMFNSRSLGMPLGSFNGLTRASQWVVLLAMAIGASPGGTGGGIKGTTLLVLGRDVRRLLGGKSAGRMLGVACVWVTIYLGLTFGTTLCLMLTESQLSADRVLLLSISAASTCGISHEPISITGTGLFILSFTMLAGRLIPLAILWWSARTIADADVAVG